MHIHTIPRVKGVHISVSREAVVQVCHFKTLHREVQASKYAITSSSYSSRKKSKITSLSLSIIIDIKATRGGQSQSVGHRGL